MLGKHSKEGQKIVQLEAIIKRKDQEIKDIRQGCADAFKLIYDLSKSNGYGETRVIMNKMGEIAKDNFNLLLYDLLDDENEQIHKIIELPTRKVK